MDLKIKDVAELLNVSETTVRRWLVDGRIPAYKLNHQYRFSRMEIEKWMMSCKIKTATPPSGVSEQLFPRLERIEEEEEESVAMQGMQHFSLFRALHKGRALKGIQGRSKEEVIASAMQVLAPEMSLDPEVLTDLLIDREHLMSTALNRGVAIPHARDFVLPTAYDILSVLFLAEPIEYGALDGLPVHTLFFLFSGSDKRHLHLLSKVAHLCQQSGSVEFLQTQPSKERLLTYVKTWEGSLCR